MLRKVCPEPTWLLARKIVPRRRKAPRPKPRGEVARALLRRRCSASTRTTVRVAYGRTGQNPLRHRHSLIIGAYGWPHSGVLGWPKKRLVVGSLGVTGQKKRRLGVATTRNVDADVNGRPEGIPCLDHVRPSVGPTDPSKGLLYDVHCQPWRRPMSWWWRSSPRPSRWGGLARCPGRRRGGMGFAFGLVPAYCSPSAPVILGGVWSDASFDAPTPMSLRVVGSLTPIAAAMARVLMPAARSHRGPPGDRGGRGGGGGGGTSP